MADTVPSDSVVEYRSRSKEERVLINNAEKGDLRLHSVYMISWRNTEPYSCSFPLVSRNRSHCAFKVWKRYLSAYGCEVDVHTTYETATPYHCTNHSTCQLVRAAVIFTSITWDIKAKAREASHVTVTVIELETQCSYERIALRL